MSVRTTVSKGESSSQLLNEVEHLSPEDRHALATSFTSTPGHLKVVLPPSTSLAIKADLSITWSKLQIVRR